MTKTTVIKNLEKIAPKSIEVEEYPQLVSKIEKTGKATTFLKGKFITWIKDVDVIELNWEYEIIVPEGIMYFKFTDSTETHQNCEVLVGTKLYSFTIPAKKREQFNNRIRFYAEF